MTEHTLVILDFDGTLMKEDGSVENKGLLKRLCSNGAELAIASRNDKYQVLMQLHSHKLQSYFKYVMADFRPKSFMIRHILWLYGTEGVTFDRVVFIDDHLPNIEEVRQRIPHIVCLHFGEDIHHLEEILEHLS